MFFRRTTPEEAGTRHWSLGNLCVLDLCTGDLHNLTLSEAAAPNRIRHGDASWTPDSKYCLLPPPIAAQADPERGILIDVRDPVNIRVVTTKVQYRDKPGITIPAGDEQFTMPERFTCSDCWPRQNDVELIKEHVDAEHLRWGDLPINLNCYADQVVSPDGTKIYFQKGAMSDELALIELDIASGKERELAAFRGSCASLDYLRPSPDGNNLAFQYKTGCNFVSTPKVYVLDLASKAYRVVGDSDGGTMHWTSTSNRLFYYRDDYLWVAEFPKSIPAPASTQPATAPPRN